MKKKEQKETKERKTACSTVLLSEPFSYAFLISLALLISCFLFLFIVDRQLAQASTLAFRGSHVKR